MIEFIDDNEAWEYLKARGFKHHRFIIYSDRYKKGGKALEPKEKQTIEYLINEWDWSYTN